MSKFLSSGAVVALAAIITATATPSYGQDEILSDLTPKTKQAPRTPRVRLQAIGMLSASHVYTTYGYIGTITDGVAHRSVSAQKAQQLLSEVVRLVEMNSAMIKRVEKSGVPKSDVAALNQTIEIYESLKTQAEAGIAFSKSQTPDTRKAFETARTVSWSQIAKLLGIGKQAGIR